MWILVKWQCVDMIAEILISSDRNKACRIISFILNSSILQVLVHKYIDWIQAITGIAFGAVFG